MVGKGEKNNELVKKYDLEAFTDSLVLNFEFIVCFDDGFIGKYYGKYKKLQ